MTGGKGSRLRVSGWGAGEHRRLRQPRLQFCWCRCISRRFYLFQGSEVSSPVHRSILFFSGLGPLLGQVVVQDRGGWCSTRAAV